MGSEISFKFGGLKSLTHLNLSNSGFGGQIPLEFYHLSNLVSLDISSDPYPPINCDIKMLMQNMTKIRVLGLKGVNISSEIPVNMSFFLTHLDISKTGVYGNLPASILERPNLQVLRLYFNYGLGGPFPSLNQSNVHSIKELDLSFTSLSGRLPESVGFLNNLNYMGLDMCNFSGPIPESIGNITDITRIILSGNELSGQVPSTISNLRKLTYLDVSQNYLQGQLPNAFTDLQKLTRLMLSTNYFMGEIPFSLTNLSQLEELDISSNALTGPFPSRAGDALQRLWHMDLSNNSIQGMIPSWLLSLPSLDTLYLNANRLTGRVVKLSCKSLQCLDLSNNQLNIELQTFSNLSEIQSLGFSSNRLSNSDHEVVNVTLPNLQNLFLSSCEIKEFPDFLRNVPSLQWLDLSNNNIYGPIPSWFMSMPWQDLLYLNLSTNYLTCAVNLPWQQLEYLDLHSNSLQGTFPSSICNMSKLSVLNLSNNKLRGNIPDCTGNSSSQLWVFELTSNEFLGKIPTSLGENYQLRDIGLNKNHLEGPLPRSLANCTTLEVLDLGNNKIHDTFPWWLETLTQLKILILKSNRFHGSVGSPVSNSSFSNLQIIDLSDNNFDGLLPEKLFASLQPMKNQDQAPAYDLYMGRYEYHYSMTLSVKGEEVQLPKVLSFFTAIDLSSNNFHGHIPESIAYLYSLRLLNLSHNSIEGSIPAALGYLTQLEQLDLSNNQLTGGIPQTLTNLTFLAVLNLSQNQLVGPIPEGSQFLTFSNDSYVGNSGLCGAPMTKKCVSPPPVEFQQEDDSYFMMGFTWKAVVIGYGCGIVFGFILGNVMISIGKPKWFARFYYAEEANCLRRKKRSRMVQVGRK